MNIFHNEDQWLSFLYGTIIGIFAGIGIAFAIIGLLLFS